MLDYDYIQLLWLVNCTLWMELLVIYLFDATRCGNYYYIHPPVGRFKKWPPTLYSVRAVIFSTLYTITSVFHVWKNWHCPCMLRYVVVDICIWMAAVELRQHPFQPLIYKSFWFYSHLFIIPMLGMDACGYTFLEEKMLHGHLHPFLRLSSKCDTSAVDCLTQVLIGV